MNCKYGIGILWYLNWPAIEQSSTHIHYSQANERIGVDKNKYTTEEDSMGMLLNVRVVRI